MVSYPVTCSIWSSGGAEGIVESYSYNPENRTENRTFKLVLQSSYLKLSTNKATICYLLIETINSSLFETDELLKSSSEDCDSFPQFKDNDLVNGDVKK
jgi:hypothetical protein